MGRARGVWLGLAAWQRRAVLALLALLLVQAQGLGLWHRVAHGGPSDRSASVSAAYAVVPLAAHPHRDPHAHGPDAHPAHDDHDAFGHDPDDGSGCRLFDHLAAADALVSPTDVAADGDQPVLAGAAVPCRAAGRVLRPYQARAPPRA